MVFESVCVEDEDLVIELLVPVSVPVIRLELIALLTVVPLVSEFPPCQSKCQQQMRAITMAQLIELGAMTDVSCTYQESFARSIASK